MKTEIYKIVFLTFGLVLLSCSIVRQEKSHFQLERQKLLSKEFELKLPIPFHTQKDNYEEGVIYFYSFSDGAYIIVFQGSMVEFPIDKYQIQETEIKNKRKITVGVEDNKFWRKDDWKGIRIYYDKVPAEKKEIYDKVLNEIKLKLL